MTGHEDENVLDCWYYHSFDHHHCSSWYVFLDPSTRDMAHSSSCRYPLNTFAYDTIMRLEWLADGDGGKTSAVDMGWCAFISIFGWRCGYTSWYGSTTTVFSGLWSFIILSLHMYRVFPSISIPMYCWRDNPGNWRWERESECVWWMRGLSSWACMMKESLSENLIELFMEFLLWKSIRGDPMWPHVWKVLTVMFNVLDAGVGSELLLPSSTTLISWRSMRCSHLSNDSCTSL